jgi:hypothetical protein
MKRTALFIMMFICTSFAFGQNNHAPIIIPIDNNFTALEVSNIDNITLEKGTKQEIAIIKGQKHQDLLEYKVNNGKLVISVKNNKKDKEIHLKITYVEVDEINASNLANLTCENTIQTNSLKINLKNLANVILDVSCNQLNLSSANLTNITIKGNSANNDINVKNTTSLNFFNLEVEKMNLVAKNGTSGKINVKGSLSLNLENYSSFSINGSPTIIKQDIKNVAILKGVTL